MDCGLSTVDYSIIRIATSEVLFIIQAEVGKKDEMNLKLMSP